MQKRRGGGLEIFSRAVASSAASRPCGFGFVQFAALTPGARASGPSQPPGDSVLAPLYSVATIRPAAAPLGIHRPARCGLLASVWAPAVKCQHPKHQEAFTFLFRSLHVIPRSHYESMIFTLYFIFFTLDSHISASPLLLLPSQCPEFLLLLFLFSSKNFKEF